VLKGQGENMGEINGDPCTRERAVIGGQHVYLMVGDTFCDVTIAHENRPENLDFRMMMDAVCDVISRNMERRFNARSTTEG